jgi:hypothetical protein
MRVTMVETVQRCAALGPKGQPYSVVVNGGEPVWFATEREAWEYRDNALDVGAVHVRIDGLPTVISVVV